MDEQTQDTQKAKITVSADINAPIAKVWDYYTLPEHVVNWNNASEDWHTPHAENDLQVGGKFSYRMESRETHEGFDFEGTYDSVEEHRLIGYTMPDGRVVETKFEAIDEENTHVDVIFDPEDENEPEFQRQGWQAILDNFKKYVEGN